MFRIIALVGFLVVLGGIGLHHLLFPCGYTPRFSPGALISKAVHFLTLVFLEQQRNWAGRIRKLAVLLGLLSFVVLLLTGFVPPLSGGRLEGYWLMLHATLAPVFIVAVTVAVLFGAQQYCFQKRDVDQLAELWKNRKQRRCCCLTDSPASAKVGFWLLAALTLPVALTMVLSMTPLFGTDGQHLLFELHRYSALGFALVAILTLYVVVRSEIRKDTAC
jgi:hypothetical protein